MSRKRKLVSKEILRAAQRVAAEVDHEDHDEAVRVALEEAAPLIAKQVIQDYTRTYHVLGRVHWTRKNQSGWMLFPGITAYRTWAKEMRKLRPEVKTEYTYLSIPGPEYMLASSRAEAEYRLKQIKDELI